MKQSNNVVRVKDDMNFLEYPLWVVGSKSPKKFEIRNAKGKYIISTSGGVDRLPDKLDKVVLDFLLSEMNASGFKDEKIVTSFHKIGQNVSGARNNNRRIGLALSRWKGIYTEYHGIFYTGKGWESKKFHIINSYKSKGHGKLEIEFDKDYIKTLKDSTFYKLIDFNEYKSISSPVALRLYEILIKNFENRPVWKIGIKKLREKLTLSTTYPSQILNAVNKALKEVNKNTHIKLKLDYNNSNNVCTFKKTFKPDKELEELISALPNAYKEEYSISKLLDKWLQKKGVDYVRGNIKYTNENYKTNFKKFLEKALKDNWGIKMVYECETARKAQEANEKQRHDESWGIYNALSDEEKAAVDSHIENDYIKAIHSNKGSRLWYYFQGMYDRLLQDDIPNYERLGQKHALELLTNIYRTKDK